MIIDHRKYKDIDFKKYKRVFIFGCSFTNYHWPTWANILSMECQEATEIYNFGIAGGGNLFIAATVAACNQKYRFAKDDLILLMWSTHSREDRYKDRGWVTPGNIWSQNIIAEDFVKEWACVRGYVVRDLALMSLTRHTLNSMPCDTVLLKSVDPDYDERYMQDENVSDVVNLYRDVVYDNALSLYNFVKTPQGGWINGHTYWWHEIDTKNKFNDYHPNPLMYQNYLLEIGFNISGQTQQIVVQSNQELLQIEQKELLTPWTDEFLKKHIPNGVYGVNTSNII